MYLRFRHDKCYTYRMTKTGRLIFGLLVSVFSLSIANSAYAELNYIYPLGGWNVSTHHGEEISTGYYHMGVDAGGEFEAGEPVYAVADGIVREAQERSQFGLVVLIEHFPTDGSANVSLYGHLRPSDQRVSVGQIVSAGDVIGVLGSESENGGWTPHLHFGIHKEPYTGVWVYYGHVHNPETTNDWFDPETYIPEHLLFDNWSPTINWEYEDGQVVTNTITLTSSIRDIGSGIASIQYKARSSTTGDWTLLSEDSSLRGDAVTTLSLEDFSDGDIYIRIVATDAFDNKTSKTVRFVKDPERYINPAFISMKGQSSNGDISRWSYGGTLLQEFLPFGENWSNGGDIASGDVTGDGNLDIITASGSSNTRAQVSIFTEDGALLTHWRAFHRGAIKVATGDVTGDGKAEIIVGSSQRQVATVRVYRRNGDLLWEVNPFNDNPKSGLDVAAGDINGDGIAEVIAATGQGTTGRIAIISNDGSSILKRFTPFGKTFTDGINVTAGDTTGDSVAEIIVGTQANMDGKVKVFSGHGKSTGITFKPFGDEFTGGVDVGLFQWDDNSGALELVTTQASNGEAWAKLYRLHSPEELLVTTRLYEAGYEGGARVAGWTDF